MANRVNNETNLTKKQIQAINYKAMGMTNNNIGLKMAISPSAVTRLLDRAGANMESMGLDNPVKAGRERVEMIVNYAVDRYEDAIDPANIDSDKDKDRAIHVADKVLHGVGVLTPSIKTDASLTVETIETKRLEQVKRFEIVAQFGGVVPKEIADSTEHTSSEQDT